MDSTGQAKHSAAAGIGSSMAAISTAHRIVMAPPIDSQRAPALPWRMDSIVIDRLSKLGPQDRVTAYCGDWRCPRHCGGVEIDVPAFMAKHGDQEIAGLAGKLRCPTSGYRPAEIRLGWSLPGQEQPRVEGAGLSRGSRLEGDSLIPPVPPAQTR